METLVDIINAVCVTSDVSLTSEFFFNFYFGRVSNKRINHQGHRYICSLAHTSLRNDGHIEVQERIFMFAIVDTRSIRVLRLEMLRSKGSDW